MKKTVLTISAAVLAAMTLMGCSKTETETGSQAPAAEAGEETTASSSGSADNYPNKPIRFILPNGAGGSMETSARKWQAYFEKEIGVPLQFEFVEGSGTLIGTNVVAEAEPDGYTLLMLSGFDFCNTIATLDAPYTLDDFDVLGINMQDPTAIMVRKDAPWNTFQELLDYMKTQPEETVTMALTNLACSDTLGVKDIENAAGVKFNSVAFNSGSKARTALIGGQADVGHFSLFGSQAILGDVKVLAIHSSENPFERFKDVPLVSDVLGQPVNDITSDYGILAPKGFMEQYPERAEKLINAFHAAWENPEFLAAIEETEESKIYNIMSPEEARAYMENLLAFVEENKELLSGETE